MARPQSRDGWQEADGEWLEPFFVFRQEPVADQRSSSRGKKRAGERNHVQAKRMSRIAGTLRAL
jgi:hypothetical protein